MRVSPSTPPSSGTRWSRLKRVLVWGAMGAFLIWCAIGFRRDLAQINLGMLAPAWGAIAVAGGLSLLNYALRAGRWGWYLKRQGHRLPWRFVSLTFMAGFAFTLSPGKLGEMARARYYQPRGIAWSSTSGAFFVERLLDLLAMIMLASVALLDAGHYRAFIWVAAVLVIGLLLVIAICPWGRVAAWLQQRDRAMPGRAALGTVAEAMVRARQLLAPSVLFGGLLVGLVAWSAEVAGLKLVADAMQPDQLSWAGAASAYAVAIIAGALSFLPGGLGSTEAVMAALLSAHGFSVSLAILLTLICRILTLWLAVGIGWICVWMLRRSPASF